MMKKCTAIILFVIICTFGSLNVFANVLLPSIVDDAGFLTESEARELTKIFDDLRYKYAMDVVVVTTANLAGKTAEEFADDYFDYEGYGIGENKDGIMLIVSENPRKYHFTATARGIDVFNNNAIDYLKENVEEYLREDDYYGAFLEFSEIAEEILEMEKQGEYFTVSPEAKKLGILAALGIPFIIALIIVLVQYSGMNNAVSKTAADEYAKNRINVTKQKDLYLYSSVTKTAKPTDNKGSTHTSMSGTIHGGGGGSY